jgi:hypothetical protein
MRADNDETAVIEVTPPALSPGDPARQRKIIHVDMDGAP